MKTHYEVLGVQPSQPAVDIRKSYLALARQYHPDNFAESDTNRDQAEIRMASINAAWAVLGDESQRERYNRELRKQGVLPPEPDSVAEVPDGPKRVYRRPKPPKPSKLRVLPTLVLIAAAVLFGFGLSQDSTTLLIAAVVTAVVSAALFFAVPKLLAMRAAKAAAAQQ